MRIIVNKKSDSQFKENKMKIRLEGLFIEVKGKRKPLVKKLKRKKKSSI